MAIIRPRGTQRANLAKTPSLRQSFQLSSPPAVPQVSGIGTCLASLSRTSDHSLTSTGPGGSTQPPRYRRCCLLPAAKRVWQSRRRASSGKEGVSTSTARYFVRCCACEHRPNPSIAVRQLTLTKSRKDYAVTTQASSRYRNEAKLTDFIKAVNPGERSQEARLCLDKPISRASLPLFGEFSQAGKLVYKWAKLAAAWRFFRLDHCSLAACATSSVG